jgi:nucleoside-diphosphate-sugar epimerase
MKTAIIFGGSGFIGSHFSQYLLDRNIVDNILVADIVPLDVERTTQKYRRYVQDGKIAFELCDVRNAIHLSAIDKNVSLVCNFAAVHREPGHLPYEYYETNLLGAKNVCEWSERHNVKDIIFTSSIAPYGPSEEVRTELSLPVPETAYGSSKLTSEYIHRTWQALDRHNRRLVIVRPGVVFGAGERGNVTRLVQATINRYFVYMANKETRKAGTYVKELCNAMFWVLEQKVKDEPVLFNMSMNPGPTIQEYVQVVCEVEGISRFVPNIPYFVILTLSRIIAAVFGVFGKATSINPVRMKKLVRSNNIIPKFLVDEGYEYQYSLKSAMEDWKRDKPSDWLKEEN